MGHNCSIKKKKFGANVTLIDEEKKKLSSRVRWCLDGSSEMGAITGFSKGNYLITQVQIQIPDPSIIKQKNRKH